MSETACHLSWAGVESGVRLAPQDTDLPSESEIDDEEHDTALISSREIDWTFTTVIDRASGLQDMDLPSESETDEEEERHHGFVAEEQEEGHLEAKVRVSRLYHSSAHSDMKLGG